MTWKSKFKAAALVLSIVLLIAGCSIKWPLLESDTVQSDTNEGEGMDYSEIIGTIVVAIFGESVVFEPTAIGIAYETDEVSGQRLINATYPYAGNNLEMTFDQKTGDLVSIDSWDTASLSQMESEIEKMGVQSVAAQWYERLPFPQGYAFQSENLFSEDVWMYSFCNIVSLELNGNNVELINPYQEVRITIDSRTGALLSARAFNYPLLNEPTPEGPKSEAEAEAIAAASEHVIGSEWDVSAEVVICLPSMLMRAPSDRLTGFSVPAWKVTFYKEDMSSIYGSSQTMVYVDLYTGEVLGMNSPG